MTAMDQRPPKAALPLLALLVLASALGVAVAIALAGAAMLLAAPAYADERGLFLERPDGPVVAKLMLVDSESHEDGSTSRSRGCTCFGRRVTRGSSVSRSRSVAPRRSRRFVPRRPRARGARGRNRV